MLWERVSGKAGLTLCLGSLPLGQAVCEQHYRSHTGAGGYQGHLEQVWVQSAKGGFKM